LKFEKCKTLGLISVHGNFDEDLLLKSFKNSRTKR